MLDGGLPAWRAAGGEVHTSPVDEAALHAPAQALRSPPATTKCAVEVVGVVQKTRSAVVLEMKTVFCSCVLLAFTPSFCPTPHHLQVPGAPGQGSGA